MKSIFFFISQKKPLFLMATIFLLAGMIVYNRIQPELISKDFYAKRQQYKEQQMLAHLDLAKRLVNAEKTDEVSLLFEAAIRNDLFDWYIVTFRGEFVAGYPEDMKHLANLEQIPDQDVITDKVSYTTRELAPELLLSVGSNKRVQDFVDKVLRDNTATILQDIFVPVAASIAIFFLLMKDILQVLKSFSKGVDLNSREKVMQNFSPQTKEAEILMSSLRGFDYGIRSQQNEIYNLTAQLTPALKKELKSNTESFPKFFSVVMVRVDINNYTPMYYSMNKELFQKLLIKFFTELEAHVQNYGGFLNEFVGDEAIFYFRQNEGQAWERALGCIRDVFRFSEQFAQMYAAALPMPWTIKTAAVEGELRLAPHLFGVTLGGAPFIESNRLLAKIHQKGRNSLLIMGCSEKQISTIAEFKVEKQQSFKGIPYSQDTFELVSFYETWTPKKSLSAFRDPHSISHQIQFIQSLIQMHSFEKASVLLAELKSYPSSCLLHLDTRWAWQWMAEYSSKAKPELVCVADMIMFLKLCPLDLQHLLFYKTVLHKLILSEDPRIYANTIELLKHFPHSVQSEFISDSKTHTHARVRANGLLLKLQNALSPDHLGELFEMISSTEKAHIISGLFVLHELMHRDHFDKINLLSLTSFPKVLEKVQQLQAHEDQQISKWAKKCNPALRAA
jgi:hypothetical protein